MCLLYADMVCRRIKYYNFIFTSLNWMHFLDWLILVVNHSKHLKLQIMVCSMHCIHFKAGWSLQVKLTAFTTESTHVKLESLVKHVESAKHKKHRDKCVAKCSGSSGSIVKAFHHQDAHTEVCDNIVIVVLTTCDLTLSSILQKTNKTPTESARIHDVMKSSRLD